MQPASKLLWKALLRKEKCAVADGALGQSQSAASAAAWAEALTPSPACLAQGGFLVLVPSCPLPRPWVRALHVALHHLFGGFIWKGTLGCVTRCWLGCSLHWSHSHQQMEGISVTLSLAPLGASAPAPSHGLAQTSCPRICHKGCSLHSCRSSCWDMFLHAGDCCILLWTHGMTGGEQENEVVLFSAVG